MNSTCFNFDEAISSEEEKTEEEKTFVDTNIDQLNEITASEKKIITEQDIDYEIGPDESIEDLLETAELVEIVVDKVVKEIVLKVVFMIALKVARYLKTNKNCNILKNLFNSF